MRYGYTTLGICRQIDQFSVAVQAEAYLVRLLFSTKVEHQQVVDATNSAVCSSIGYPAEVLSGYYQKPF